MANLAYLLALQALVSERDFSEREAAERLDFALFDGERLRYAFKATRGVRVIEERLVDPSTLPTVSDGHKESVWSGLVS